MPLRKPVSRHPVLADALADCRRGFWSVAIFSGVVNMLMLAGPLYMLQVYDRVLASHSVPTLLALSVLLVGCYGLQALLDLIRNRVVVRIGGELDRRLGKVVHHAVLQIALHNRSPGEALQPVRSLDQIRAFLTSAGPIAIVDLPWMPVFLFLCFLIHPWLGVMALVGAIVLLTTTLMTERASREPTAELARGTGARSAMIETDRRNSETVVAMGMAETLANRWTTHGVKFLQAAERSSDVIGFFSSLSKVLRLLLQSMMLGLGAYLVIRNEVTAGAMIAASIMMSRSLAPIETAIANWRGFAAARDGLRRLGEMLTVIGAPPERMLLPAPHRSLEVEAAVVAPPGSQIPIVNNVQFKLTAGDVLAIVGPSGSGKTSLVRVLTGAWPAARGKVRIDGATLDQWSPEVLGPNVGYVSQAIELFDGTIAENIARMAPMPDADAIIAAARAAGAHDMILRLPKGYDTPIGDGGVFLSAGQRQRVALARALFRDPFLIVLDEANANLDGEGESALLQALRNAKARGAIVVMIAHRASMLAVCDKVLVIKDGVQQAFGPRDEVMSRLNPAPPAKIRPDVTFGTRAAEMGPGLKVVADGTGGAG